MMPASSLRARRILTRAALWLALLLPWSLPGQPPAGGAIAGRVFNTTSGQYVSNARLSLDGFPREVFSDELGYYRLPNVPAGRQTVRVFYTGMKPQTRSVDVAAGQTTVSDFNLGLEAGEAGPAVTLDPYVVAASREMNAAVVAINEQRFAAGIKSVASTDSFGEIAEGNVGDFAKFLPGVTIDYAGGGARSISVGGVPPSSTPVMIDGNLLASAASSSPTRLIELEQVSVNNMSRIEVSRSQNADQPASGIGGAVNLISRNAFERARPAYTMRVYGSFRENDLDHLTLKKTPGPYRDSTYKVGGNLDFTAIVPVTRRFGFTLSGLSTRTPNRIYSALPGWVPNVLASTAALPATSADQPYLGNYSFGLGLNLTYRHSLGLSGDFRLSPSDTLSAGLQYSYHQGHSSGMTILFDPVRVASFGPAFTQGAAGAGRVQVSTSDRDKSGTTYMPTLRYVHTGPVWHLEAGGAYSNATNHYRDISDGFWNETNAFLRNVTIRFDQPGKVRPETITVLTAAGQPANPFLLSNYLLETGSTNPEDSQDTVRSLRVSARRSFGARVPLVVKTGIDLQSQARDIKGAATSLFYLGPDGVAASADNNARQFLAEALSSTSQGWGFPSREMTSAYLIGDLYKAQPSYFQINEAQQVAYHRNSVNASKQITETIYAPYMRVDTRWLGDRLALTAGLRFEGTEDRGNGALIDPSRTYQRDAAGNIVRNAAGAPVVTAAITTPAGVRLAYVERGARTSKSYGDFFPSINAAYHVTGSLLGRASYARSIARPDFGNILPALTVPDPATPSRVISLTNPHLKPWTADSYGVSLEYYFDEPSPGFVAARAYLREISDFWGAVQVPASDELLDAYGLDATTYGAQNGYVISTRMNGGAARVSGLELDYRQHLGFLGPRLKGLTVFGNLTLQHLEGSTIADFIGFVQKTINFGVSYSRDRFTGRVGVNLRGRERAAAYTGAGAEPGTYNYKNPRDYVDVSAEYRFSRRFAVFGSARDLLGVYNDFERYGPSTPQHARLRLRQDIGTLVNVGLKAEF